VPEARAFIGAGLTVVLLSLGAGAVVAGSEGTTDRSGDTAPDPVAPRADLAALRVHVPAPRRVVPHHPARGVPHTLAIPRLGVDAEVQPIGIEDDVLVPPDDVTAVGWWRGGALPGSRRGTTLLAGHSWQGGDGVFDRLAGVEPGDLLTVTTARGRVDYRVESVAALSRAELARASGRLFSQAVAGRLVAITCTDYRDGAYRGNTVVVATPSPRSPRE
jgi:LPXTG-site transpeptidase (sortase) family protein